MELLLQYLDDLDDAFGMVGLLVERVRRFFFALISVVVLLTAGLVGVWLAVSHPMVGLATSVILLVLLLYRSVTSPVAASSQTA